MALVDGHAPVNEETGPPFMTYAAGGWNAPGDILAVDAYKAHTWYTVCFTRAGDRFTLTISGDFRCGGTTTYEATMEDASSLFHYSDPHYWLLGDPHINYYEGSLLVDDITLTVGATP